MRYKWEVKVFRRFWIRGTHYFFGVFGTYIIAFPTHWYFKLKGFKSCLNHKQNICMFKRIA